VQDELREIKSMVSEVKELLVDAQSVQKREKELQQGDQTMAQIERHEAVVTCSKIGVDPHSIQCAKEDYIDPNERDPDPLKKWKKKLVCQSTGTVSCASQKCRKVEGVKKAVNSVDGNAQYTPQCCQNIYTESVAGVPTTRDCYKKLTDSGGIFQEGSCTPTCKQLCAGPSTTCDTPSGL